MKVRTENEHKKMYMLLWTLTYILFFPFVILSWLYDLLEVILGFVSGIRCKIVYKIMEFLYERKERIKDE